MLDINLLRNDPERVKENIRKKFQDEKLPLVDEVIALDAARRAAIAEVESLKAARNKLSKANGPLYGRLKKGADDAERAAIQAEIDKNNAAVKADDERRAEDPGGRDELRDRRRAQQDAVRRRASKRFLCDPGKMDKPGGRPRSCVAGSNSIPLCCYT